MEEPRFPREFVRNHCSKVLEARRWRKSYGVPGTEEDDMDHAECAFVPRGFGMECENCRKFLCSLGATTEDDAHLPAIRKFYKDIEAWEEERSQIEKNKGAFI